MERLRPEAKRELPEVSGGQNNKHLGFLTSLPRPVLGGPLLQRLK